MPAGVNGSSMGFNCFKMRFRDDLKFFEDDEEAWLALDSAECRRVDAAVCLSASTRL